MRGIRHICRTVRPPSSCPLRVLCSICHRWACRASQPGRSWNRSPHRLSAPHAFRFAQPCDVMCRGVGRPSWRMNLGLPWPPRACAGTCQPSPAPSSWAGLAAAFMGTASGQKRARPNAAAGLVEVMRMPSGDKLKRRGSKRGTSRTPSAAGWGDRAHNSRQRQLAYESRHGSCCSRVVRREQLRERPCCECTTFEAEHCPETW